MIGLAVAAAAALSGAVIENQEVQHTIADLPAITSATGGGVELTIDPTGKVLTCAPITTVGESEVTDALCGRLGRARLPRRFRARVELVVDAPAPPERLRLDALETRVRELRGTLA